MTEIPETGEPPRGVNFRAFMPVPIEWLTEQLSVDEAELRYVHEGRPFGYLDTEWNYLKSMMGEHDEIWIFSSSAESWEQLMGREGVALVQNGQAIGLITQMN
jgi:hypothetical protein